MFHCIIGVAPAGVYKEESLASNLAFAHISCLRHSIFHWAVVSSTLLAVTEEGP
jgi:hypothetical protein